MVILPTDDRRSEAADILAAPLREARLRDRRESVAMSETLCAALVSIG
jgi:hypothetical protein